MECFYFGVIPEGAVFRRKMPLIQSFWALAIGLAAGLVSACAGGAFDSRRGDCEGGDCPEPRDAGSGGSRSDSGQGGSGGMTLGNGGMAAMEDGSVSPGEAGVLPEAGNTEAGGGFPSTPVLDDFNRSTGVGLNWLGAASFFGIEEGGIACEYCPSATFWAPDIFGANQEAYATFSHFDDDDVEMNILLKAQGSVGCDYIEILVSPVERHVRVDYCHGGNWTSSGSADVRVRPGDQVGGRAHADGTVEIFLNGVRVLSVDASDFPYERGRIGVNGIASSGPIIWDDFGGGNFNP